MPRGVLTVLAGANLGNDVDCRCPVFLDGIGEQGRSTVSWLLVQVYAPVDAICLDKL